ncbi:MAG: NUDIX hydrolase [Planctomycetota bacterium]
MTLTHDFCPLCGSPCEERVPEGDHVARAVCTNPECGAIHYVNPKVVVGCIVEAEGGLLLARRDIEPARGRWTFPAGYLEVGESMFEGAARETVEETEAEVEELGLHALLDIPNIGQAYTVFRTRMIGARFGPTPESSEVRIVPVAEIPWDEISFPSVQTALRLYVDDLERGEHAVHTGVVEWSGEGSRFDLAMYRLRDHRRVPRTAPDQ